MLSSWNALKVATSMLGTSLSSVGVSHMRLLAGGTAPSLSVGRILDNGSSRRCMPGFTVDCPDYGVVQVKAPWAGERVPLHAADGSGWLSMCWRNAPRSQEHAASYASLGTRRGASWREPCAGAGYENNRSQLDILALTRKRSTKDTIGINHRRHLDRQHCGIRSGRAQGGEDDPGGNLENILTFRRQRITNGVAEGLNNKIMAIKWKPGRFFLSLQVKDWTNNHDFCCRSVFDVLNKIQFFNGLAC